MLSKTKKSESAKWLKPFNCALVSIYMAAFYVSASIESASLNQPTAPAHSRRNAGRGRPCPPPSRNSWATCFSRIGIQDQIYSITKPIMLCSAIIIFNIVIFGLWLKNLFKEKNLLIIFMCMLLISVMIWLSFQ
jgi:hypothetical protein